MPLKFIHMFFAIENDWCHHITDNFDLSIFWVSLGTLFCAVTLIRLSSRYLGKSYFCLKGRCTQIFICRKFWYFLKRPRGTHFWYISSKTLQKRIRIISFVRIFNDSKFLLKPNEFEWKLKSNYSIEFNRSKSGDNVFRIVFYA